MFNFYWFFCIALRFYWIFYFLLFSSLCKSLTTKPEGITIGLPCSFMFAFPIVSYFHYFVDTSLTSHFTFLKCSYSKQSNMKVWIFWYFAFYDLACFCNDVRMLKLFKIESICILALKIMVLGSNTEKQPTLTDNRSTCYIDFFIT